MIIFCCKIVLVRDGFPQISIIVISSMHVLHLQSKDKTLKYTPSHVEYYPNIYRHWYLNICRQGKHTIKQTDVKTNMITDPLTHSSISTTSCNKTAQHSVEWLKEVAQLLYILTYTLIWPLSSLATTDIIISNWCTPYCHSCSMKKARYTRLGLWGVTSAAGYFRVRKTAK